MIVTAKPPCRKSSTNLTQAPFFSQSHGKKRQKTQSSCSNDLGQYQTDDSNRLYLYQTNQQKGCILFFVSPSCGHEHIRGR